MIVSFTFQLVNHIPAQCLPCKLGGSLEVKHEAWLLRCFESMSNRCDIYNEDSVKNLDRPSESGVEETERNLNEKDSTDDFKSSCVDSSEALFEGVSYWIILCNKINANIISFFLFFFY